LAQQALRLARRNQALGDFAALVAHELKTPLELARLQDDPLVGVERALGLVDVLLQAAHAESAPQGCASAADCLDEALGDLGPITAEVTTELSHEEVPLSAMTLRVLLRNLVANAVAAGARHIHVATVASAGCWRLTVDDDGVGLPAAGGYVEGSRLGLSLCRRLVGRFGGTLELAPRPGGGTRASVVVDKSQQ
jgi:signal transduction histidine kinase